MNAFIRLLYAVLIAGAVVAFIGVGISSFYQPPKFPEPTYKPYNPNASEEELNKEQEEISRNWEEHDKKDKAYHKNVVMILLPLAAASTVLGLVLLKKYDVIGEGLALGGVGTSVYGIISASVADEAIWRFIAVTLLLLSAIALAHKRFLTPATKKK